MTLQEKIKEFIRETDLISDDEISSIADTIENNYEWFRAGIQYGLSAVLDLLEKSKINPEL